MLLFADDINIYSKKLLLFEFCIFGFFGIKLILFIKYENENSYFIWSFVCRWFPPGGGKQWKKSMECEILKLVVIGNKLETIWANFAIYIIVVLSRWKKRFFKNLP